MFAEDVAKIRASRTTIVVLTILLYGQGLLGLAAVAAVVMKDRGAHAQPPVVAASIAPAAPAS